MPNGAKQQSSLFLSPQKAPPTPDSPALESLLRALQCDPKYPETAAVEAGSGLDAPLVEAVASMRPHQRFLRGLNRSAGRVCQPRSGHCPLFVRESRSVPPMWFGSPLALAQ